jgi:hypothetical protein
MSYNVLAFYVAETNAKKRLKAALKPIAGINHGRKRPLILTNDKRSWKSVCATMDSASLMSIWNASLSASTGSIHI